MTEGWDWQCCCCFSIVTSNLTTASLLTLFLVFCRSVWDSKMAGCLILCDVYCSITLVDRPLALANRQVMLLLEQWFGTNVVNIQNRWCIFSTSSSFILDPTLFSLHEYKMLSQADDVFSLQLLNDFCKWIAQAIWTSTGGLQRIISRMVSTTANSTSTILFNMYQNLIVLCKFSKCSVY